MYFFVSSQVEMNIDRMENDIIRQEIGALGDHILFGSGDYQLFLLRSSDAPHLMRELYRLREVTFRAVGEGTGQELDTDEYDTYYRQLILWNVPNGEIAGAYRLGFGPEIMPEKGIEGFYTASLFKYSPHIAPILEKSIELGRSFIVAKYQREVLALKLLLTGLAAAVSHCPEAEYFMGPVSMSASIPSYYQTLVVYYLKRDFAFPGADELVGFTHPFQPDPACDNPEELLKDVPVADIDALDRRIAELSDGQYRLPVLFRKYFSFGARVACFNVDPLFSNCVDGLIFTRHRDYPENTLRSFTRSMEPELRNSIWEHFRGVPYIE